jgi:hypothetical protein
MFNYATYNGVPIITYGLIGLTTSILALVSLNPSILELKEDGEQTTVANAIGLDNFQMPAFMSQSTSDDNTTYVPGLNGMPQPFSSDEPEDELDDEIEDEPEDDSDDESISEEPSVYNPLRRDKNTPGGRKTKRKKLRKAKRNKLRKTKRNE